jgi:SAM-dependent methyltransferase
MAERRVSELARFTARPDEPPLSFVLDAPEEGVESGYARWASTYDAGGNWLIELEEPVVHAWIDRLPPGRALDAACGTGRHTAHLHARGHAVIGTDTSEAMLARARGRLPGVDLRRADLAALPIESASMDLVICALALTHVERLEPVVRELARVLRAGGRIILSDFHPLLVALGGTGFFVGDDGRAGYVTTYCHPHSEYLASFRSAGLGVEDCAEPVCGEREVKLMAQGLDSFDREAFAQAFGRLPGALVWQLMRG